MLSPDMSNLPLWIITASVIILVMIVGFFLAATYKQVQELVKAVMGIRIEMATMTTEMHNTKRDLERLEDEHKDLRKRI